MPKFPKQPTLLIRVNKDSAILDGLIAESEALGWRIINMALSRDYIPSELEPVGAIVVADPPDSTMTCLREMDIPIVHIWRSLQEDLGADVCLMEDRRGAGHIAADAFAERGFKEFGYVTFEEGDKDGLYLGFRERAEAHGASVHLRILNPTGATTASHYEKSVDAMAAWFAELPRPLALLAYNSGMATRNMTACRKAGLSVPEDVAIACRGNDRGLCMTTLVPMSAIDMNEDGMGRRAVQMVQRLANGEPPPSDPVVVPVKGFVPRRSTDILAVRDPMVAKAVRFIWDHINWPLCVDDIALEVNTSRATLHRAFTRSLGRGVNEELRRKRLEVCKVMLRTTKLPLYDIAKAVGLTSRRYLHRSFKDAFGITPREYRLSKKTEKTPNRK